MIRREWILLFSSFAAVSFFLPGCAAMAGGNNAVTSALKNLEPKNKPVYFVHIFDGDFPVPTRFEIQPNGYKETGSLRFTAPSLPLIESMHLSGGGLSKIGRIEVGTSSSFISKFWKGSNEGDVKKFKCYGLHVEIKATPDMRVMKNAYGESSQVTAALIHNAAQYVLLFSTDNSLWSQLLSVYGALSDKEEGPTCPIHEAK